WFAVGVRAMTEELDRPHPRDRAKGELQHAGPVDACERRVRGNPALQLANEDIPIAYVSREPAGAPERNPVLVAIDFPDHLVVTARGIEIGHRGPEPPGTAPAMHGVEVPIGWRAVLEIAVAEQVEPPVCKPIPTCD